jgi:hypothetical protein
MWIKAAMAAAAAGLAALARSRYERTSLSVETIELETDKIRSDRTLVFLSDLHNNEFGRKNEKLIAAIDSVKPDAVLSGGDMMVVKKNADVTVALSLLSKLASRYPVYCGNGNHENRMERKRETYGNSYEEYKKKLKDLGVTYLEDTSAFFGDDIRITALDLDSCFYRKALIQRKKKMPAGYMEKKLGPAVSSDTPKAPFQILLAHSPLYFKEYADWGGDLTLSGHFHGGTIRLPILGGVMTPQYQFFLPVCAGTFHIGEKTMVVSRGLGTHSINIRLNNRPQLVVLKLRRRDHGDHNL